MQSSEKSLSKKSNNLQLVLCELEVTPIFSLSDNVVKENTDGISISGVHIQVPSPD